MGYTKLHRINQIKLYRRLRNKVSNFILELYPDHYIDREGKLDISICNKNGDRKIYIFFAYPTSPTIRIARNQFTDRKKEYLSVIDYIEYEIYKYGGKYDRSMRFDSDFILFGVSTKSTLGYHDELVLLKLKDIDKIELSKDNYEIWLSTRKFGL